MDPRQFASRKARYRKQPMTFQNCSHAFYRKQSERKKEENSIAGRFCSLIAIAASGGQGQSGRNQAATRVARLASSVRLYGETTEVDRHVHIGVLHRHCPKLEKEAWILDPIQSQSTGWRTSPACVRQEFY